jgi:hypothetical protein
MANTVFPVPVTSASAGPDTIKRTTVATAANTYYSADIDLQAGYYAITCVSTTITTLYFFNGDTFLGTGVTSSGVLNYNVTTPTITKIIFFTNAGSNIEINFQLSSINLTKLGLTAGTVTQITSSQTYTGVGTGFVVAVGGGGGGGGGREYGGGPAHAGGGGSGGVSSTIRYFNGSTPIVIGSFGTGEPVYGYYGSGGNGGGTTTVDTNALISNGGGGGSGFGGGGGGTNGVTGAASGGAGGGIAGGNGVASAASAYNNAASGTTGGGSGGGSPAGSGIGRGGNSGGAAATGYGAGGGGGNAAGGMGGSGTQGLVYIQLLT